MSHETEKLKLLRELLSDVEREFDRRRKVREERRQWYAKAAAKLLGKPVTLQFTVPHLDGVECRGQIGWTGQNYLIKIHPNLVLNEELWVFCHEVAHGLCGQFNTDATEADVKRAALLRSAILDGTIDKETGFEFAKTYQQLVAEDEREANEIADKLFALFCAGQTYAG